jgi:hypothetical protein
MSATEILRELCAEVYGQNIMSEGTVRQWCRMFNDGRTDVHDEERSGSSSVMSDNLVQSVDQKIIERRCFTMSELPCEFPQIPCTVLYEIIGVTLGYLTFCTKWLPIMLTGDNKMQRLAPAFVDFFG